MIARAVRPAQVEDGNLPVEAHGRAGDQGLVKPDAGTVDRVPGGKVVGGVDDDVGRCDQLLQARAFNAFRNGLDHDLRIDARQRGARRLDLGLADGVGEMHDLPLQVGQVHNIVIANAYAAHAAGRQV